MSGAAMTVTPTGPSRFRVELIDGDTTTTHDVEIPEGFRKRLAPDHTDVDGGRLVRETFVFLLEREPATSILPSFGLDIVSRFFPEYLDELRTRLAVS